MRPKTLSRWWHDKRCDFGMFGWTLADLRRARTLAVAMPADRLLERLYRDTGLTAVFSARAGGRQRVANLHQLDQLARQCGLIVTGGSDYHGSRKPWIELGRGQGNLRIPYRLLEELKNDRS